MIMKFNNVWIYKIFVCLCFVFVLMNNSYSQDEREKLNKMTIPELLKAGDNFFLKKDFNSALEYYIQAWSIDSNNKAANIAVVEVLFSIKDYNMALSWLERSEHKFKNIPQLQLLHCAILQEKGLFDESLKRLLSLQNNKNFKNDYKFWFYLGIAYFRTKNAEEARIVLEKSIRMNSNFAEAHYLLGKVMIDLNLTTQGLLSYYYYLLLDPTSHQAAEVFLTIKQYLHSFNTGNFDWLIDSNYTTLEMKFEYKVQVELVQQINSFDVKAENSIDVFNQETDNLFTIIYRVFKDKKTELESDNFIIKYIPYFYKIKTSNTLTTFLYYIGQSTDKSYLKWLETHPKEYENFTKVIERG